MANGTEISERKCTAAVANYRSKNQFIDLAFPSGMLRFGENFRSFRIGFELVEHVEMQYSVVAMNDE